MTKKYSFDDDYFQPVVELYLLSANHYRKFFPEAGFDLTPQQWHALNRLWLKDGISQSTLAEQTFKDDPYTTRLVDKLVQMKLVYREQLLTDRRVNLIFLTKAGKALKQKIHPVFGEMAESLREGITDKELADLKKLCGKLIKNYRSKL